MNRPCPSCNSHSCNRIDCYTTEPEHDDEETISKLTLDECRKLYGLTEVHGDPFLNKRRAA